MYHSQPDNLVSLCADFKLLPLFMSLKIDCFHSQRTVNICIAGLNRVVGYAAVHDSSQIYYLGMKTAYFS